MTTKPETLYTTPTLHKGSTTWYVEFYYWNDSTNKMERVRRTHELNRTKNSPNLKAKKDNFNQLLDFYIEELEAGYDPFNEAKTAEVKKSRIGITLTEARKLYAESLTHIRDNTKEVYLSNIDTLIMALGNDKKANDVTSSDVTNALQQLEKASKSGKWRNSSFNNKKASIGTFFEFLKQEKHLQENPVNDVKRKSKQTTATHEIFTKEDLKTVLQYLDIHDSQAGLFCRMVYYTCIRPNELRQLQVNHVNMKTNVITVPDYIAKNKTEGYVNIDVSAIEVLHKLGINERDKDAYLFAFTYKEGLKQYNSGLREKEFHRGTMLKKLVKCLEATGLDGKGYTLYSFKHTSNVNKYLAGWTIAEICAANRHKSLVETETYLKALLKFAPVTKEVPSID